MSNRLNVKQSKKDRPKSSDKLKKGKRESSPDKPGTPSGDILEEGAPPPEKPVIVNDEILALQITKDNLEKLHDPRPPSVNKSEYPQVVRKNRPRSEWDKPAPKRVVVQRAAPPEAPLKPYDFTGGSGARFDKCGNIIPYSILGTVEDYKTSAVKSGEIPKELAAIREIEKNASRMTVKYEKRPGTGQHPMMQSVEESNALKNWQAKMRERRKQQGYLANLLNKSAEHLVMNQSDNYRQTQEQRYLIDRTIPTVDYGKGYRIGSEFWKQQEGIGDDNTGMHMTLTQTERGYPPAIEQIRVPDAILREKGTNFQEPKNSTKKTWDGTQYMRERTNQLQPIIDELVPHRGDLQPVAIVGERKPVSRYDTERGRRSRTPGSAGSISRVPPSTEILVLPDHVPEEDIENFDPLSEHPDVHPAPVFGPSLLFAGQAARWTGDSVMYTGQIGLEARVTFESITEQRVTSTLDLTNDGTTTMYYDWKQLPKSNPFDVMNAKVQRFYFNTTSGVLLPGDSMKFPFIFKSPNPGVFTEKWQLQTRPVLCGGATLVVTLRGVAIQEDKYKNQRNLLERELEGRKAQQVVLGILDDILAAIQSPDRPRSPVDAYITEEEIFTRRNPKLYYHSETVRKLQTVFMALYADDGTASINDDGTDKDGLETEVLPPEWDLSVDTLSKLVMSMDETDERKQEFLHKMNSYVLSMSFPPFNAKQQKMHSVGYELFCDSVDRIVENAATVRTVLGIPDREPDDIPEETINPLKMIRQPKPAAAPPPDPLSASQQGLRRTSSNETIRGVSGEKPGSGTTRKTSAGDSKRGAASKGPAKPDPKDKKGVKEAKGVTKTPSKEPPKTGGKITPATSTGRRPPSTRGRGGSAGSGAVSSPAPPTIDPVLDAKYKEKIYSQSYQVISDMIVNMVEMFEDIENQDGGPKLPVLT